MDFGGQHALGLEPEGYDAWCTILASERTWLIPGRRCYYWVPDIVRNSGVIEKVNRPRGDLTKEDLKMKRDLFSFEVVYVDYENQKAQLRPKIDTWFEKMVCKIDSKLAGGLPQIGFDASYPAFMWAF